MINNKHTNTYILGGGYMKNVPDKGAAFYQAIIGNRTTANVLICCFAMSPDKWQEGFETDRDLITMFNGDTTLSFKCADMDSFTDQIDWADIIIFRGGSSQELIARLNNIQDWREHISHKTVVGASAGVYMLSSYYVVTDSMPRLTEGLGLLPIVVAAHYRSTFIHDGDINKSRIFWDEVDELMESQSEGRDIIKLREGEFLLYSE
ncbi:MAG: hypothetical protein ACD_71C00222G0023 [uncultured bacterium (gcode 4)]|uniref:Peptidase n=1 Tax=uncultured bacterium (gcode 4) TaxID=1234023 RepID=K2A2H9_9BACT|nr:MAG: hypothetical protein ACD_71C00222G0023 [uncultured bacterium (gcode 4)]